MGEAYPDLKANQNFLALQEELSPPRAGSPTRQFYNDSVLEYNNKLQQFPTVYYAKILDFQRASTSRPTRRHATPVVD